MTEKTRTFLAAFFRLPIEAQHEIVLELWSAAGKDPRKLIEAKETFTRSNPTMMSGPTPRGSCPYCGRG